MPAPADAQYETRAQAARAAVFPSTVGVFVLAAVALVLSPTMTALLGGGLAGMGVASAVATARILGWENGLGGRLWVDGTTDALYVRRS